jgi:hypothetical protein
MLGGKPEVKIPVGISWCRWKDNIEMDLNRNRVGRCGMDSFGSVSPYVEYRKLFHRP